MKHSQHIIFIVLLLSLSSCSWVHNVQVNTLRPAQVNYEQAYPSIIIVNNCQADSLHESSKYIDENGKQYRLTSSIDSISQVMAMSLGTHMYDSQAFERVEIFTPDSNTITGITGLDEQTVSQWQSHNDVHIAINAITPIVNMQVTPIDGVFCTDLSITTQAYMQCFVPQKEMVNVAISDTLYWQSYGDTPHMANAYIPNFEECLDESINSVALKAANYFAPHTRIVNRLIFVTGHPAMKDAFKYWESEQYTEASYIWEYVYENAKDKGRRAKAAANMALYNEIEEQYSEALKYAQVAASIFSEIKEADALQYLVNYIADIECRIKEATILDNSIY